MKKNDIQKLKEKGAEELVKELASARGRMSELRISVYRGKKDAVKDLRETKKKIARILTFIKQSQNDGK
ncbi:MAG: 50S ribosomal protein L29 [Patescibacteria group bacterium]|nr:50S ribosomal protein L29 [Patescibacteria group bacterium]